ncbi:putative mismatched base pair and cruciform dna recognition [Phaeomoniella chlamydospora]|uniref:Putative mismatched base pair and cruciform dna recognition n=1 Tax=Phaeomoniella chlamydospora TaxID=158046 RepID=A0A0G2ES94_PHACM|nr:putative mismatched base pair and cruciform dna recognition [Phaeomoniella chlamydospora]
MSDSTIGATADYVKATLQSGVASVTGSTGDAQKAQETHNKAEFEDTASHATAKVGPFTATPSGVAKDSPDTTQGQTDQTIGSAKQAIGGVLGSENLKQSGENQVNKGKETEAKGELSDLANGTYDRVAGAASNIVSAVTGDREAQATSQDQHDSGKAKIRGVQAREQSKLDAQQ